MSSVSVDNMGRNESPRKAAPSKHTISVYIPIQEREIERVIERERNIERKRERNIERERDRQTDRWSLSTLSIVLRFISRPHFSVVRYLHLPPISMSNYESYKLHD